MSKRSLFWNDASGKLGNVVMYRAGGEQRSRQYVAQIKNPKTLAQQTQRVSMLNFNSAFSRMKSIIKWSFPLRASNQSGWNAFVSANKNLPKQVCTQKDKEAGVFIPTGMFFSKGNIDIPVEFNYGDFGNFKDAQTVKKYGYLWKATEMLSADGAELFGSHADVSPELLENQGGILFRFLVSNGNPYNFPTRFKLTILHGFYSDEFANGAVGWNVNAYQVECFEGSTDNFKCVAGTEREVPFTPMFTAGTKGSADGSTVYTDISKLAFIHLTDSFDGENLGLIISWSENGATRVNTAMMQGRIPDIDLVADWRQDGTVYDQVLENLGVSADDILSTPAISNADRSYGFGISSVPTTEDSGTDLEG